MYPASTGWVGVPGGRQVRVDDPLAEALLQLLDPGVAR